MVKSKKPKYPPPLKPHIEGAVVVVRVPQGTDPKIGREAVVAAEKLAYNISDHSFYGGK